MTKPIANNTSIPTRHSTRDSKKTPKAQAYIEQLKTITAPPSTADVTTPAPVTSNDFSHHTALPPFMVALHKRLDHMENEITSVRQQLAEKDDIINQLKQQLAQHQQQTPQQHHSQHHQPQQYQHQAQQQQQPGTTTATATTHQEPTMNPWQNVTRLRKVRQSMGPTTISRSLQKIQAAARVFFPPSPNQGFQYVYLNTNKRLPTKELRTKFRRLGITTSRLLDIHYPTKNVLAILVHNDFTAEFLEHMTKFDIRPINDFDPNDPAHLQDPEYTSANLTEDDKATHMITILNQRMRRTLEYIRTPLQRAVGTYFVQQGWIDETELVEILTPTTPDTEMNDVDTSFLTPSNSTDDQADF
ncbi:hypothetical protein BC941DRAFT_456907 [Chlamydoabsidia padenii]|nr:hypothetical protein BC941DRAFT_456907 [Chlamydoabsidia padenii]